MIQKLLKTHSFLVGVSLAVCLAWLIPALGARGGLLRSEVTTQIGVFVIFLFQGLTLPTDELRRGVLHWRLHVFCQASNYLLLPLLGWGVLVVAGWLGEIPADLRVGFLYLAILPTTVSTAIVFTGKAEGNVVGSLFNTTVSNVLGVFLVPVAATWIAGNVAAGAVDMSRIGPLLVKIASLILLPLILGQVGRVWLKAWAVAHKKKLSQTNVYIIYFMIFAAFCNSFAQNVWVAYGIDVVVWAIGLTLVLLVSSHAAVFVLARLAGFGPADQAAGLFCGAQKTLAAGVPMAGSIFTEASPVLGVVLLPIMFYHPTQILLGSYLTAWFERQPRSGD